MLFAHADWLARRWLAKYYSPLSSRRETKWLPVSSKVTINQLSYSLIRQLLSLCGIYLNRIIHLDVGESKVMDIYLAASRLWKYPPLFTSSSVNIIIIDHARLPSAAVSGNEPALTWI